MRIVNDIVLFYQGISDAVDGYVDDVIAGKFDHISEEDLREGNWEGIVGSYDMVYEVMWQYMDEGLYECWKNSLSDDNWNIMKFTIDLMVDRLSRQVRDMMWYEDGQVS